MSRLISVDELKEWIKNWFDVNRNYHPYSKQNNIPIQELYDILERMPTIEERKKGKWEERKVSSEKVIDEWQSARCSVCGRYYTTPYMYYFDDYSYCPNCGADMRGED